MAGADNRKRILVTGGAGFIGSHLTDALLAAGHEVVVLDNLRNGSLANLHEARARARFRFVQGDILSPETCSQATRGADVVFHLACLGVRHSLHSPFENHRVNAEGSLNVLESCRQNAVPRFFYISTSEVYGITNAFPITEQSLTSPATVYGASKLAGENYAIAYHRCFGLRTTVLRIFNNYGPRAHYEGDAGEMIPRTIVNVLHGRQPVVFGDGSNKRDFFYVKDTARALLRLMDADGLAGATLNIGTGKEISMREIAERLLRLMGKEALGIQHLDPRPGDVPRLWVDASAFYRLTGFTPAHDFDAGLRETISYYERLAREKNLIDGLPTQNWKPAT